jgi:acyl-ACP thioesterase
MALADGSGVEIGAAVTLWAMIDLSTRRPLDLSALSSKGTSLVDREPPIEKPRKVAQIAASDEVRLSPKTVVYSDIDFNGHVNSMKYLEWMVDVLPPDVPASLGAFRLDINYLHEAKLGEVLTIASTVTSAGAYHFDIRNAEGASICRAAITPES